MVSLSTIGISDGGVIARFTDLPLIKIRRDLLGFLMESSTEQNICFMSGLSLPIGKKAISQHVLPTVSVHTAGTLPSVLFNPCVECLGS